jgi:hypothetical protein
VQLPSARTFIAGETETAAFMNSLSTAVGFLLAPPRALCYPSGGQVLTTGVATAITMDSEAYDTDNMHNPGVNPTRFTPQTAGLYEVTAQIGFVGAAGGLRQVAIYLNGAVQCITNPGATGVTQYVQVEKEIYLNGSSDYMEMFGTQTSGGNLSTGGGVATTFLQARWVAVS